MNPSEDVADVVSPDELLTAKNPESEDCCVLDFLECCPCVTVAAVVRFDIIDGRGRNGEDVHLKANVVGQAMRAMKMTAIFTGALHASYSTEIRLKRSYFYLHYDLTMRVLGKYPV